MHIKNNDPIWDLADVRAFAWYSHENAVQADGSVGQLRKYTNEPYIVHPLAVAGLVASVPGATKEMIAAALLHDVVEDTDISLDEIQNRFGTEVARQVDGLSDMQTKADGSRQHRKQVEKARLAKTDWAIQTIKLADLISNTSSIVALDPNFASVYLQEKAELLEVLTKGDKQLHNLALKICQESQAKLDKKPLNIGSS